MSELLYIPYAVLLLAVILIYAPRAVVGREMAKLDGGYNNDDPRLQQAVLQGVGKRALNAHHNAIEALPIFGLGVLAALQRGGNLRVIAALSIGFAVARVLYLVFYLRNNAQFRSACWALGLVASLALYVVAVLGR